MRGEKRRTRRSRWIIFPSLLILYVVVIGLFAAIYRYIFPGDFYAPYAHNEPTWGRETARVAEVVGKAMTRASSEPVEGRAPITLQEYRTLTDTSPENRPSMHPFIVKYVDVYRLEVQEGPVIRFHISYGLQPASGESLPTGFQGDMIAHFHSRHSSVAQMVGKTYGPDGVSSRGVWGVLLVQRDPIPWRAQDPMLRSLAPRIFGNEPEGVVELSWDEANLVEDLLKTYAGLAQGIGSDFWRMFYFSAVVITTLGLGDIVPLTSATRLLVAAEATLGIIILGVFVSKVSDASSSDRLNTIDETGDKASAEKTRPPPSPTEVCTVQPAPEEPRRASEVDD